MAASEARILPRVDALVLVVLALKSESIIGSHLPTIRSKSFMISRR